MELFSLYKCWVVVLGYRWLLHRQTVCCRSASGLTRSFFHSLVSGCRKDAARVGNVLRSSYTVLTTHDEGQAFALEPSRDGDLG